MTSVLVTGAVSCMQWPFGDQNQSGPAGHQKRCLFGDPLSGSLISTGAASGAKLSRLGVCCGGSTPSHTPGACSGLHLQWALPGSWISRLSWKRLECQQHSNLGGSFEGKLFIVV